MNARACFDAAVEVDRGKQRFVSVGQQRLFAAAARLLLAAPEQQMLPEHQALGLPRQRRRRDERRLDLGLLALVELRKLTVQQIGNHEPQHRVAEKFQRFVVGDAAADVLVGARGVGHRVLEQPAIAESIVDRVLERVELVADPDDFRARDLGAVALDDSARLVRLVRADRDPDFPELVDVHRKHRMQHRGGDDRAHAVGLEQAAHDARLDVGVRAKDDDQVSHGV